LQTWASELGYWERRLRDAFKAVDRKLAAGVADPITALWAEHSGGDPTVLSFCGEDLQRQGGTPPNETARSLSGQLKRACQEMRQAVDPFDRGQYLAARTDLQVALARFDRLAP
jgi:hypothetical protein